jgi:hypothetical protein
MMIGSRITPVPYKNFLVTGILLVSLGGTNLAEVLLEIKLTIKTYNMTCPWNKIPPLYYKNIVKVLGHRNTIEIWKG